MEVCGDGLLGFPPSLVWVKICLFSLNVTFFSCISKKPSISVVSKHDNMSPARSHHKWVDNGLALHRIQMVNMIDWVPTQ